MNRALQLLVVFALVACSGQDPELTCRDDGTCELAGPCDADEHCTSGLCETTCLAACVDEDECPTGQGCRQLRVEASPVTACVEVPERLADVGDPCSNDDECRGGVCWNAACSELCQSCFPGASCVPAVLNGARVSVCEWAPVAPNFTTDAVAVTAGTSDDVAFEVPSGVESFVAVVRDSSIGLVRRVGVSGLTGPGGALYAGSPTDLNPPSIPYNDGATVMVPIRDVGVVVEPGSYTLTAGMWDIDTALEDPFVPTNGELYVDVLYERGDHFGGLLDLHFFTPAQFDAAHLDAALEVVATQFSGAGLGIGRVTTSETTMQAESPDQLRSFCRTTTEPGQFGASLNVVLAPSLSGAEGFTGATPSPPGFHGLASSCNVVELQNDPLDTGLVLAHEIGHFLGLHHTTSWNEDGSVFGVDPITDTPTCDQLSRDCADASNVMSSTVYFGETHSLSAGQLAVVSRNPLLYELVRPDLCPASPAREITVLRTAAGFLAAHSSAGSCGGPGAGAAHVLRVHEAGTFEFAATGAAEFIYVRASDCENGAELACTAGTELTVDLDVGEYYVFVDGAADGAYTVAVSGP